ncbi:unnamed protein product [Clonostachys rosea]|uniref:Uncharacterized protein n=1 Tax=Bionectria ochroleuca TaxID=29856 RepID=A0ABY6V577_BIOOC|nr:unnamed protein product [Clonostachys rosea]
MEELNIKLNVKTHYCASDGRLERFGSGQDVLDLGDALESFGDCLEGAEDAGSSLKVDVLVKHGSDDEVEVHILVVESSGEELDIGVIFI